ncbi:hypothetical protein [Miniimonas arenae]|uniref:hypothetical protein n=1 Tax=Miniimonas arenae TaxID=676201 RepID=UPI0015D57B98|nr:hypothetical protein [Miniimonas arenae]
MSHRPLSRATGLALAGSRRRAGGRGGPSELDRGRILADWFDTEHVFTAIVGLGIAHFHQHVFVRDPGTPATAPWHDPESWDEVPRLDAGGLDRLADALRARFDALM